MPYNENLLPLFRAHRAQPRHALAPSRWRNLIAPVVAPAIALLLAGCVVKDPLYCTSSAQCEPGTACDVSSRTCVGQAGAGDRALGMACKSAGDCKGGRCVDGVCCDGPCSEVCKACNVKESEGTCTLVPLAAGANEDCPGEPSCGNGTCDGKGACIWPNQGKVCESSCDAITQMVTERTCGLNHVCEKTPKTRSCSPYRTCASDGRTCLPGCQSDLECVADSLCDFVRVDTSPQRLGVCVDPKLIVWYPDPSKVATFDPLNPSTTLQSAVDALVKSDTATHLALKPSPTGSGGKIIEPIAFPSGLDRPLTVVGIGLPELTTKDGATPVISMGGGSTVHVQGLRVTNKGGGANAAGVQCVCDTVPDCNEPAHRAALHLRDSFIENCRGLPVGMFRCNGSIRRTSIVGNFKGGAWLSEGDFVVTNSVIANNIVDGALPSSPTDNLGKVLSAGLRIDRAGTVAFGNNVVAYNTSTNRPAGDAVPGAIVCAPPLKVYNSIFYKNAGNKDSSGKFMPSVQGCILDHSMVDSAEIDATPDGTNLLNLDPLFRNAGAHDYALQAQSPAIDKGIQTAPAFSTVDLERKARVHGKEVDLGAIEFDGTN